MEIYPRMAQVAQFFIIYIFPQSLKNLMVYMRMTVEEEEDEEIVS